MVSVLVPTFNRSAMLSDCLYSLSKQDFDDFEVVVRDNHSEDDTEAVVRQYEPLFKDKAGYRYIRNETNEGFINNFQNGVSACNGKYCLILMDDDFLGAHNLITLYATALERSDDRVFAFSRMTPYYQGHDQRTRVQIIDDAADANANAPYQEAEGTDFFLNFWTKYGPIVLSSFMFDRQAAIDGNWRTWGARSCPDQNLALSLTKAGGGVIFNDRFSYYGTHDDPNLGEVPGRFTVTPEMAFDSHSCMWKWFDYGREDLGISRRSLLVYRWKTIIRKDNGVYRWLRGQSEGTLTEYWRLVRGRSYLDYLIGRYLSPQMIRYDLEAADQGRIAPLRPLRKAVIGLRRALSKVILRLDAMVHDGDTWPGLGGRLLRRIAGTH